MESPAPARFRELKPSEQAAYCRRLRLVWACQGDLGQLAGVEAMIETGRRIALRRGGSV